MRDNYMQQYERQIMNQKQQINKLQYRSQQLENQLQSVKLTRNQYELILQRDSVTRPYIGMGENSIIQRNSVWDSFQSMEQRLQVKQRKIKLLEEQLYEQKNIIQKIQNQITQYQAHKNYNQRKIKQLENEKYKIGDELNRKQSEIRKLNQAISAKNTIIQNLTNKNLQLEIEKRKNTNKMSQQFFTQVQTIKQTSNNWLLLNKHLTIIQKQSNSASNQENKQLLLNLKNQQEIMQEMGRQLDERNEQLAKYISNQGINVNPNNQNLQIKSFEQQRKKKEKMFRQLLQKYQSVSSDFKRLVDENRRFQSQFNSMKAKYQQSTKLSSNNSELTKQLQSYRNKDQLNEKYLSQYEQQIQLILKQNEVLQQFMFAIYGRTYNQEIQNQVGKYTERLKNRTDQLSNHWNNVTELLKMNRKLAEICRMKH